MSEHKFSIMSWEVWKNKNQSTEVCFAEIFRNIYVSSMSIVTSSLRKETSMNIPENKLFVSILTVKN